MSTRLNKSTRENLRDDVLRYRFAGRVDPLVKENAAFAQNVYEKAFSEKERELMESLPGGWLPEVESIRARLGTDDVGLYFNGYGRNWHGPEVKRLLVSRPVEIERRVPECKENAFVIQVTGADPLAEGYQELKNKWDDLDKEYTEAKNALTSALNSVYTIESLIKEWPEIESFALKYRNQSSIARALPTLPVNVLNTMLGLPPKIKEAA